MKVRPPRQHIEKHFTAGDTVRDIIIGVSDGLTVPFALAAGLSGAVGTTAVIVIAGVAEVAAGAIAMGLGGYLAAQSDSEHYKSEHAREIKEVAEQADAERLEVRQVFRKYGLTYDQITPIIQAFEKRPTDWVNFMMRFELGMDEPDPKRAPISALTIGFSYIGGGLIPLTPYMVNQEPYVALLWSAVFTLIALFTFGYIKGTFVGVHPLRTAFQTVLVGGLAGGCAFGLARLVSH
ncbi:MAG: VIT1/CCC1 transporter family protein [Candidatus Obscuribacterales bacterium]|nr:VIT1/CCC1 transporter family protein [Candidatus Obscuribacterales bacterium]